MKQNIVPYNELLETKGEENIVYADLLMTKEWYAKREEILKRDRHYCTNCGLSDTIWHNGILISFDKKRKVDGTLNGERIILESLPFKSERPIYLHIHHSYYIIDRLPWKYDNESLLTLCNWCHWQFHEENTVPIYRKKDGELLEMNYKPCFRCNGAGVFPEYKHVQNGICFRCNGSRYEERISQDSNKKSDNIDDSLS